MKKAILLLLISAAFTGFWACKKDKLITDTSAKLDFSTRSILFDTVFTQVGSVTKSFKVYNRHNSPIKISSVRLVGGTASNFRLNVDGSPGIEFADIRVEANDSLFIFVEVTVDPNNQNNPIVISDSVEFITNNNAQFVHLEAWGQDAHFIVPTVFPSNGIPYSTIPCNAVWTNDKPYVIYGLAIIPSGCSLTIQQGCRIHLHAGAILAADSAGTLIVNGAQHNEVTFQGDRLEPAYADAPGQWGFIWLSSQSVNNSVNWAIIKNGYIGLRCDSFPSSGPSVTINNTIIKNMSAAAVYGIDAKITGYNSVFANCGQYVAALTIGGEYNFFHCTFANYWNYDTRQFPTLILNNYYTDVNNNLQTRALDSANFYNCIIYGSIDDEIKLDQSTNTGPVYNYKFHYCDIKTTGNTANTHYTSCVVNQDPAFMNVGTNDYRLGPLSNAINKGDMQVPVWYPFLNIDLAGHPRILDGPPDCGAYEYAP
ncbi:MAG TPA: hypothetical protein VI112_06005 [Bacteroidia bacterium]|jgi:hypothetical protein